MVVLVDGEEGHVKIWDPTTEGIWLRVADPRYRPIFVPASEADRVKVIGVVTVLHRQVRPVPLENNDH